MLPAQLAHAAIGEGQCEQFAMCRAAEARYVAVMSNGPAKNLVRTKRIPLPPGSLPADADSTDTTEWLGAYFVVDHRACGLANLPGTDGDATGFIENEAKYQKENFLYGDGDVLTQDFAQGVAGVAGADNNIDPTVPARRNGIDSVVIAYIATHGVVASDGNFVFVIGSRDGTCNSISTKDMKLGDGYLRYLFVSTCESVKAVSPGKQWFQCAKGLRAVFGYDGTIADSPDYGRFFFEEWKKDGVTTTQAFIRASWRVNPNQIAVAAWFGHTAAEAQGFCDTETHFQHEPIDAQFIAHHRSSFDDLQQSATVPGKVRSMTLIFDTPAPLTDPSATLAHFVPPTELDQSLARARSGATVSYRTSSGTRMMRNARSGSLDITFPRYSQAPSTAATLTNAEAITAATAYLSGIRAAIPGIHSSANGLALALRPSAVRRVYSGMSSRDGVVRDEWCTDVTVVFRQTVNGIPTIGPGGLIEVTLDGEKQVSRVRAVTREIATPMAHGFPVPFPLPFPVPFALPFPHPGANIDVAALRAKAEERAKGQTLAIPNVSTCTVVKSEFGFYAADEGESQHTSELTFRVLVEYKTGQYSRIVQKFYTVGDLNRPTVSVPAH